MKITKNLLTILQQEEYSLDRFNRWLNSHPDLKNFSIQQKPTWTPKFTVLFLLSSVINLLTLRQKPIKAIQVALVLVRPIDFLLKASITTSSRAQLLMRALQKQKLVTIGITGSYGKTSTKFMLKQILGTRYKVLATPESYNTPLGIAMVILKYLKREHEVFIVEMGAYQKGEIRRLCKVVQPQIGILTAIGPMHLERFGSLENIISAKSELIESLPPQGTAILNADNTEAKSIAQKTKEEKYLYSVVDHSLKNMRSHAQIQIDHHPQENGCQSTRLDFDTNLLGRHQVSNIAAASAAALHLGVSREEIQQTLSHLEPIPHRLQLIDPSTGILILDDTYSSNPAGFREALNVLSSFANRRKILVTPGMVELGNEEKQAHFTLGKCAASICDLIILVGKNPRTLAFQKGLSDMGFNSENLFLVKNSQKAQERLRTLGRPQDIVLLENDLPDKYL